MSEQTGFFGRLRQGLSRSAGSLVGNLSGLFRKRRLDDAALEELEDVLIAADLGPLVAADVAGRLRETRFNREVDDVEIREALAEVVAEILAPLAEPMNIDPGHRPHVVLVVGVNGSGKTTTIGKMAKHLTDAGMTVVLAAGDTFRAAAVEQLQVWGERTGAGVVVGTVGAGPRALRVDRHPGAEHRVQPLDPRQAGVGQGTGGQPAVGDGVPSLGEGEKRGVGHGWPPAVDAALGGGPSQIGPGQSVNSLQPASDRDRLRPAPGRPYRVASSAAAGAGGAAAPRRPKEPAP